MNNTVRIGYLHTVDLGSVLIQKPLQNEPILSPPLGNVSYEFYFNYTGHSQSDGHQVGFFVTDPTYENPVELGVYGKAMSLQYSAGSNVAFPLVGASSAIPTTFNKDNKVLINLYFDDSTFVPKELPRLDQSFNYCKMKTPNSCYVSIRTMQHVLSFKCYVLVLILISLQQIIGQSVGNSSAMFTYQRYHGSHMVHLITQLANELISLKWSYKFRPWSVFATYADTKSTRLCMPRRSLYCCTSKDGLPLSDFRFRLPSSAGFHNTGLPVKQIIIW